MVATGRRNVRKRLVPKKSDVLMYEREAPSDVEQLLVFDTETRPTPDQRLIFLVWRPVIDIAYASDLGAAKTALLRKYAADHVFAAAPVCGRLASRLRFVSSPCGASLAPRSVASQIEARSVDRDPVGGHQTDTSQNGAAWAARADFAVSKARHHRRLPVRCASGHTHEANRFRSLGASLQAVSRSNASRCRRPKIKT